MNKLPGQRVAVLVDGRNIYLSVKARVRKSDKKNNINLFKNPCSKSK